MYPNAKEMKYNGKRHVSCSGPVIQDNCYENSLVERGNRSLGLDKIECASTICRMDGCRSFF